MFGINTYSRLKQCLVLQHYASSGMAMKKRTSGSVELDLQHRFHHLNCEHRSISSVCHDRRDFHTSSNCAGKNLMRKFVNKTNALKPPKKQNQEDNMRTRVLNSILYKAITDLLSSPEVSLPADFSSCRVYWKTSGVSERDDQIQQALDKSSPRIRLKTYSRWLTLVLKIRTGKTDWEQLHVVESGQPTTSKKPVLFGVDHEALNKQILDYKLRVKETTSDTLAPELTLQQLEVLAEYRKQKVMEKKKKSKRPIDDDITPKEYLLSRHSQGQEGEDDELGGILSLSVHSHRLHALHIVRRHHQMVLLTQTHGGCLLEGVLDHHSGPDQGPPVPPTLPAPLPVPPHPPAPLKGHQRGPPPAPLKGHQRGPPPAPLKGHQRGPPPAPLKGHQRGPPPVPLKGHQRGPPPAPLKGHQRGPPPVSLKGHQRGPPPVFLKGHQRGPPPAPLKGHQRGPPPVPLKGHQRGPPPVPLKGHQRGPPPAPLKGHQRGPPPAPLKGHQRGPPPVPLKGHQRGPPPVPLKGHQRGPPPAPLKGHQRGPPPAPLKGHQRGPPPVPLKGHQRGPPPAPLKGHQRGPPPAPLKGHQRGPPPAPLKGHQRGPPPHPPPAGR
ncbi:unnamed protein product [Coregonus sp. 'balchen']|nr:unnamed protein product [Coregonus sp. 'balchen']